MKEWILICNANYYDIKTAFSVQKYITWPQIDNVFAGDIVYCYVTNPYSAVLFKCEVSDIGLHHMDDSAKEYVKHVLFYENKQKYMRLQLLTEYPESLYTESILKENGIENLQMTTVVPDKLSDFLHNKKCSHRKWLIVLISSLLIVGVGGISWRYYRSIQEKEQVYKSACLEMDNNNYGDAMELFKQVKGYKDSDKQLSLCEERIAEENKKANTYYTIYLDGDAYREYRQGDIVQIEVEEEWIASDYSCGGVFSQWTIDGGRIVIEDPTNTKISFVMPERDVHLTAVYSNWDAAPIYLQIENGSGSCMCYSGDEISITADNIEGYEFSSWILKEGTAYIADIYSKDTMVSFDKGNCSGDVVIEARYKEAEPQSQIQNRTVEVVIKHGEGSGVYEAGTDPIPISAEKMDKFAFLYWAVETGSVQIEDVNSESTFISFNEDISDKIVISAKYQVIK